MVCLMNEATALRNKKWWDNVKDNYPHRAHAPINRPAPHVWKSMGQHVCVPLKGGWAQWGFTDHFDMIQFLAKNSDAKQGDLPNA